MKLRTKKKRASRAKYGYRLFAIWEAGHHLRWQVFGLGDGHWESAEVGEWDVRVLEVER